MEKYRQIVFTKPCVAEFLEKTLPELGSNQVAVKTAISSISCGTERALASGEPNVSIVVKEGVEVKFPRTSGYSSSGVVVAVGSDVTDLQVGDRVAMSWSCHSEINVLDRKLVFKIDDSVSFSAAALCHIATFPMAAIRRTKLEMGESMLVMGLGILGLFAVQLGRIAGAVPVIAVDPVKERREKAISLGADYAFDPTEPDFVEKVKAVTGKGVNTAIEVTGLGVGLDQCLDCMAKFGRIALLGCTRNSNFSIDYYSKVHAKAITIVGAHTIARPEYESSPGYWTHIDDIKAVFSLLKGKRLDYSKMICEIHSPKDCQEVYTRLVKEKTFPVGVLFDWNKID